jgi:hypothetical protein
LPEIGRIIVRRKTTLAVFPPVGVTRLHGQKYRQPKINQNYGKTTGEKKYQDKDKTYHSGGHIFPLREALANAKDYTVP